jgi:hypothetical protein
MNTLSLRDAAFALDGNRSTTYGQWTVKESIKDGVFPPLIGESWSIREITNRYSASGSTLRALAQGVDNAWVLIDRDSVVDEISARLRDPLIINQQDRSFCGPFSILVEWIRRDPVNFITSTNELLETGKFTCRTGRVIEAEVDLRQRPVPVSENPRVASIAQVEWLLAATIRDDENITEDVNDGTDIEGITMMGAMSGWTEDILNLTVTEVGGWESSSGEDAMMHLAEATVKAGGVAFLFVDANMIQDGGDDDEEEMYFQRFLHRSRLSVVGSLSKCHSKDDNWPPDHWVIYLDGLNFGKPPDSSDAVAIRLWSWASEYMVTGTAEAFGEYLYGVVAGN